MALRRATIAVACLLAAASPTVLSACGEDEPGVDEPAREGLALELEGWSTTSSSPASSIRRSRRMTPTTRVRGRRPARRCTGSSSRPQQLERGARDDRTFKVPEPELEELPRGQPFAYNARLLKPEECIPEAGSVAALGPGAGSMLLFRVPLATTENRRLELEIEGSAPRSSSTSSTSR